MAEKRSAGAIKAKTKVLTKKVSFEFPAPEAQEVYLVGNFNNWDTSANPMKKDKKGLWKATVSLRPGRYEYRFLVDRNWQNDPSCCDCVSNEFGSENCIRIVE
jgi:1,4-alpha-glucan branching enzyme